MQKQYNLATPELINKLWLRGAEALDHKKANGNHLFRVRLLNEYVDEVNPLLTGTKFAPYGVRHSCIYSKDVWNALLSYNVRRSSYGHDEPNTPTKTPSTVNVDHRLCKHPAAFTFSDGQKICLCNDQHRRHVLCPQDFTKAKRSLCRECEAAPAWKSVGVVRGLGAN